MRSSLLFVLILACSRSCTIPFARFRSSEFGTRSTADFVNACGAALDVIGMADPDLAGGPGRPDDGICGLIEARAFDGFRLKVECEIGACESDDSVCVQVVDVNIVLAQLVEDVECGVEIQGASAVLVDGEALDLSHISADGRQVGSVVEAVQVMAAKRGDNVEDFGGQH